MPEETLGPNSLEITRKIEISGLSEEEADKLRKRVYSKERLDSILRNILSSWPAPTWQKAQGQKWQQWLRALPGRRRTPVEIEELTTSYEIRARDDDDFQR